MKSKSILLSLFVCLFSMSIYAQRGQGEGRQHRHPFDIEKHLKDRVDFISKELNLTEQERKDFIPLMEEYIHARFLLNKELREASRDLMRKKNKTSEDYEKMIEMSLDMKFKELELEKEYYKKFKKVLPAEKIFKYERAERKFMQQTVRHQHREIPEGQK